jgi:hypothetical protein
VGTTYSRPPGDIPGDIDQSAVKTADRPAASLAATHEPAASARPYPPSWVDRLTSWVQRLPFPSWAFYLAGGVGLSLVYMALLLWSSGGPTEEFPLVNIVLYGLLGMTCAYLLGMIHYLDNSAAAALARFRPVLTVDDAGYERLRYELTTLPARPTLIASLLGVVYSVADQFTNFFNAAAEAILDKSQLLVVLVWAFNALIYVVAAVLVYHTLHQLLMVNEIYTQHTRINIFQQGTLYALSGLTARTALGIGIVTYVWFQADSMTTTGNSALDVIQAVFLGAVVAVTFVSPLLGAHRILEREKQRLQDEAAGCVEAAIADLNGRLATGELAVARELKEALEGLVIEEGVIEKLRTWPWRTETVRGLGAAFVLPIFIWLVQRILERLGL